MTKENIDKIILLSLEKKKILNEILNLTKEQKNSIEKDDLDFLGQILEDKENLMKKVDLLDKEFLDLYNSLKEKEGIQSFTEIDINKYDNIKKLKNVVGEINSILTEISKVDKENKSKMEENIKNIKINIKNVKKGKRAYKGYNYQNPGSILIDEKK